MMKEEARLDLCIHHVAEQSLLSSYQRPLTILPITLPHKNLNHKSPHYKPIEFSTRLRERDHSGIRTQDKLLFHFNIFFEFLWMETMFSIGDDQADEERVWNNWIGIESLTLRSAQP